MPKKPAPAAPAEPTPLDLRPTAQVQEVQRETQALVEIAATITIRTDDDYQAAGEFLKSIKAQARKIDTERKKVTKPLDDAKATVMNWFRPSLEALEDQERRVKRAMGTYYEDQERRRREEQRKADEAARKERERLERQAQAAAAKGNEERADHLAARAASVAPAPVAAPAPKAAGISQREVWEFDIVNPAALPREYLIPDEAKIRKVVNALKGDTNIAGVQVRRTVTTVARSQ